MNTTDRDLSLAQDGGFNWVKQHFEWRNIERDGKGQFLWDEPDRIVNAISQRGLQMVVQVDNQPKWASSKVIYPASSPPDRLLDWTDFLVAVATRYEGRIHAYEIWDGPNLSSSWGGPPSPTAYADLLKASYRSLKSADPGAVVVSAGLAPTTTVSADAMPDVDFVQALYEAGAKGSFDVLGVSAVGFKSSPCMDPGEVAARPELTNSDPSSLEAKRVYAFRHVEDVRAIMVREGDSGTPIGILRADWTTDLRPQSNSHWQMVTPREQAEDLVGAFGWARLHWAPWLSFLVVGTFADPGWTPYDEGYWRRITNPDGSHRLAYDALQAVLAPAP
ncbi:MAG: hypothetical protein ACR2GA_04140 [Chloroflexota bacterium]